MLVTEIFEVNPFDSYMLEEAVKQALAVSEVLPWYLSAVN